MRSYFQFLKELDSGFKKNAVLVFLSYFFTLFSYPFTRSVSQSLFYDHYTAQDYSLATFFSVLTLIAAIYLCNKVQELLGAQKLFGLIGIVSVFLFGSTYAALANGTPSAAFYMFAVKEAYIVLMIHLILAYTNATFTLEQVKRLFGPIGAIGSVGGIVGGQLTSQISSSWGVAPAFGMGLTGIVMACVFFSCTQRMVLTRKEALEVSPLKSVQKVKRYVFLIAAVVAVTQWVIFIADLQFNILFEEAFSTKGERTAYLGKLYSMVNVVSLFIQFVILPWLLVKVSTKKIFFAVPLVYLVLILGGVASGAGALFASAFVFVSLKGMDYSVFSIAKEVMYYPLDKMQKFGAKYITDMFVYRLAKALIAFVMAQFLLDNLWGLAFLQSLFIAVWIGLLTALFKEQTRVNREISEKL